MAVHRRIAATLDEILDQIASIQRAAALRRGRPPVHSGR